MMSRRQVEYRIPHENIGDCPTIEGTRDDSANLDRKARAANVEWGVESCGFMTQDMSRDRGSWIQNRGPSCFRGKVPKNSRRRVNTSKSNRFEQS